MGCRPDLKGDENKWMETGCPVKSTSGQEGSLARGLSSTASVLGEPSLLGTTQEKIQYSGVRNCSNGPLYRRSPAQIDTCAVLSSLVLLKPNVQGYRAYETVAGHTVCVSGIFPSKHHWKKIRFSHISCGVNSLCPGTRISQIQPVTTKISFQNYIWTKQVRMFLLSLLIQNSSTATNLSFAFCFSL